MTDEQSKAATEPGQAADDDQQPQTQQPQDQAPAQDAGSPEQRAEEYLRLAQRAQADLINYRRRVDQERDDLRTTARVDATAAILPVLDDFERAISAIPEQEREKGWVQGILLIERNLRSVVER